MAKRRATVSLFGAAPPFPYDRHYIFQVNKAGYRERKDYYNYNNAIDIHASRSFWQFRTFWPLLHCVRLRQPLAGAHPQDELSYHNQDLNVSLGRMPAASFNHLDL
jgi:hypothetical protein